MKFMYSQRGRKLILYCGNKFYKKAETSQGWKWNCTIKTCTSKIYVDEKESMILSEDLNYNHDVDKSLSRQLISNSVKRKAMDDLTERPSKAVRKEICNTLIEYSEKSIIKDIEYIKKNFYRARRKELPPLPRCISDVHDALCEISTESNRSENMLFINNRDQNIVCFTTESNIKYLSERTKIFVDGTFMCCLKYFYQLFTVHSVENGNYISLMFFLLPDKNTETYKTAFQEVSNLYQNFYSAFAPNTIVADFESAIHNAAILVWPGIKIVDCRFHVTQSWWRKIQNLGLSNDYQDKDSEIGKFLRRIFGLTFLDENEVGGAFVEEFMFILSDKVKVQSFTYYLTENYITEEAKFPPILWASSSITSERTTNACESFHFKLNRQFSTSHPNIFTFVDVIKQLQVDSYVLLNSVHNKKKITNGRYRKRKENTEKLLNDYRQKKISRYHFLNAISYHYKK